MSAAGMTVVAVFTVGFMLGIWVGHMCTSSVLPEIADRWRKDREDARRHALAMAQEQTKQLGDI